MTKLEKELSDLAVIYEQHEREKKISPSSHKTHSQDTCKVINVQGVSKVEASHSNSPTRKPRPRSKSRTKRTQHTQHEPEPAHEIVLEQPKRGLTSQQSRQCKIKQQSKAKSL